MKIVFILISFGSLAFANYGYNDYNHDYYNNGYSIVNISSPPVTNWGIWGPYDKCPGYTYAQAIQVNYDPYQDRTFRKDDIGMTAIKLFCGDPSDPKCPTITSTQGPKRTEGKIFSCYPGYIYGFQLRVDPETRKGIDCTATDNIRVICDESGRGEKNAECDGDSVPGKYGDLVQCPCNHAICAIQTQMDSLGPDGDDTALNNVRFGCCDFCGKYETEDEYDYDYEDHY